MYVLVRQPFVYILFWLAGAFIYSPLWFVCYY